MQLTREEQETLIRTDAVSREWNFWTFDPKFVRLAERKGYRLEKDHQGGWSCKVPSNAVSFRKLKLKPAERSERQIAAAERLGASSRGIVRSPEKSHGFAPEV